MKTVNLHFKFVRNQFIREVRELSFEGEDVNLANFQDPNNAYVYEGDIKGLWVIGDLEIVVNCRGLKGFVWSLEVKVDGVKLTPTPIEGKINSRGISIHFESYKLPVQEKEK
ncbi:MAG: hypothetical protein JSV88_11940 [Candidatus Aminicenantes bacterium]|nr:MAG: hypothetical protein JSV88_11940 [Candidatus Aminicenantes bacterium]